MTTSEITAHKDAEARTMTIESTFGAPPDRVWQVWADPRQLERWWGPPEYPATVTEHDLRPGGMVRYYMTSPEGDHLHAYMRIEEVEAPTHLAFQDGFADDEGTPDDTKFTTSTAVDLTAVADGTRMVLVTRFATQEDMDQAMAMGMDEGMVSALGQIDGILAGG